MNITISNLLLVCLSFAILIPSSIKIGGITIFDMCLYGLFVLCVLRWSSQPGSNSIKRISSVECALYLLLLFSIIAYICNYNSFNEQITFIQSRGMRTDHLFVRANLYGVLTLLMLIGTYRISINQKYVEKYFNKVIKTILIAGGINAFITILYWVVITGGVFARYNYMPPLEGSAGIHAYYMNVVFLFAFALLLTCARSKRKKLALISIMFVTGFSMLTVMVRQAWIMFAVSIIIFLVLYWKYLNHSLRKRIMMSMIVCIVLSVYLVPILYEDAIKQSYNELISGSESFDDEGSLISRIDLINHGLKIFLSNPILGVGYGHYPFYSTKPIYVSGTAQYVASPHNGVISVMAQTGLIGIGIYLFMCHSLIKANKYAIKISKSNKEVAMLCVIMTLLIIALVEQLISNTIILPLPTERMVTQSSFVFWVLLGLVALIDSKSRHLPYSVKINH